MSREVCGCRGADGDPVALVPVGEIVAAFCARECEVTGFVSSVAEGFEAVGDGLHHRGIGVFVDRGEFASGSSCGECGSWFVGEAVGGDVFYA